MKATLERFKLSVDKLKMFAALAGIFFCGVVVALAASSWYTSRFILDPYDRQVDRLTAQLTVANTDVRLALTGLAEQAQDTADTLQDIVATLKAATTKVTKAASVVKGASESVAKAQVRVKEVPVPAPKPERPKAILPYQETRIEH